MVRYQGFLHRPSGTHKHSLQAFYVYVHDDHTVKINPLMSSFWGNFDGDCVHTYYPSHLPEINSIVVLLGRFYLGLRNDGVLTVKQMSSRTIIREGCTS